MTYTYFFFFFFFKQSGFITKPRHRHLAIATPAIYNNVAPLEKPHFKSNFYITSNFHSPSKRVAYFRITQFIDHSFHFQNHITSDYSDVVRAGV